MRLNCSKFYSETNSALDDHDEWPDAGEQHLGPPYRHQLKFIQWRVWLTSGQKTGVSSIRFMLGINGGEGRLASYHRYREQPTTWIKTWSKNPLLNRTMTTTWRWYMCCLFMSKCRQVAVTMSARKRLERKPHQVFHFPVNRLYALPHICFAVSAFWIGMKCVCVCVWYEVRKNYVDKHP